MASCWKAFGASVKGSSHNRTGKPNQDAIAWRNEIDEEHSVVLCVSDGHGSAKCFRSDKGSKFAVEAAVLNLSWAFQSLSADLTTLRRTAVEILPRSILRSWQEKVKLDLLESPFTGDEREAVVQEAGLEAWLTVQQNPLHAYGATLLAAAANRHVLITFQIGDGDILQVNNRGAVSRMNARKTPQFGEETASLCLPDAWQQIDVVFKTIDERQPALVLLSTDGYSNSFKSETGFLRVGGDILEILREDGIDSLSLSLPKWLEEASRLGSGDDVTLGLIVTPSAAL